MRSKAGQGQTDKSGGVSLGVINPWAKKRRWCHPKERFRELRHQDGNNSAEVVDIKPQTLTNVVVIACISMKTPPPSPHSTKEDSPTDVTLLRLRMWWLMLGLCSWCLTELLRSLASMHSANELESHCSGGATPSLLYSRIARNLSKPHLWPSRRTVCYTPLLSINPPRRLVVLHLLSLRSGGLGT